MAIQLSITEAQAFETVRTFLLGILPEGTPVVQTQINRVAEPDANDFVLMTLTRQARLATNVVEYPDPLLAEEMEIEQKTQISMQLDVHGDGGGDNSQIITTLFRDAYAVERFEEIGYGVAPLFCSDSHQVPFINAENQYEDRWVINLEMQVNPAVVLPQQFFDSIQVNLIEVDAKFPPQ